MEILRGSDCIMGLIHSGFRVHISPIHRMCICYLLAYSQIFFTILNLYSRSMCSHFVKSKGGDYGQHEDCSKHPTDNSSLVDVCWGLWLRRLLVRVFQNQGIQLNSLDQLWRKYWKLSPMLSWQYSSTHQSQLVS
jgi:hypothetical protein